MSFELPAYAYPRFELAAVAWPGDSTKPRTNMDVQLHVPEGTYVTLLARVRTEDNTLLQHSDVQNIVLRVFEKPATAPASEVYSGALTVGDGSTGVVKNTMQTDARWRGDSIGYNFIYTVKAAQLLARGGVATRYEVTIKLASQGGPVRQSWTVHAATFLGQV